MTSVKGWHTGRLWSMTLSASTDGDFVFVFLCFFVFFLYYYPIIKTPF